MRLAVFLVLGVRLLCGQTCAPAQMLPVGSISGTLDMESCRLSDDSAYAAYRLDVPVQGRIEITMQSAEVDLFLILRNAAGNKLDSGVSISGAVEAGSYIVLVNARTPGQLGAYVVSTKFTAERGMLCSHFPSLGLNQTVSGTLGMSGCVLPDGRPYEAYGLNTFGSGTLTVAASSSGFVPAVIIRSADGSMVSSGSPAVAALSAGSEYRIVIESAGGPGNYQVVTSFAPAADEPCVPLKTIKQPENDSATVSVDGCITANPQSSDLAYFNYYNLTVSQAGTAEIAVSSSEFTPAITLLDDAGNLIDSDSGSGGATLSEVRASLRAGMYVVQVVSTVFTGGAYQLTYGFNAGPIAPCRPRTAAVGDVQAGTISASSCRTSLGPADLYGFTLPTSGTVDLTLSTFQFTSALALRDAKDNLMVLDEDLQAFGESHVSADLPAGSYTVAAAARYDSGDYQLTASFTSHEIPACAYVQALDLNGGYIQKLGARSCHDGNGQPVDFYEFTLPSDSVVAAVLTSSEIDGQLTLTDASGNVLRSDDNSYGFRDPLIVQYLPAGTYRVEARAAGSTAGGYYQVDLRTIAGPRPVFCAARAKLEVGATITGTIQFSGCPYNGAFADIYEFRLPQAGTVDLQLTSAEFDAYLILLDEQGNVVAEDDNSGGDTNARFTDLLAAGTYFVVARPAADYFSAGGYTLSLSPGQ